MSCEQFDLKEYFFGEASRETRRRVEGHLEACPPCREELSRLQLTQAAMGALREEEIPRRIAFVSDKVFEPRWFQRLWNSGPQLGFIAASLLAGAILIHAFTRPAVIAPPAATTVATLDQSAIDRAVRSQLDEAVTKAVAASEARQQKKTVELLQAAEHKYEIDRRATIEALTAQTGFVQKALNRDYALNSGLGSGQ